MDKKIRSAIVTLLVGSIGALLLAFYFFFDGSSTNALIFVIAGLISSIFLGFVVLQERSKQK